MNRNQEFLLKQSARLNKQSDIDDCLSMLVNNDSVTRQILTRGLWGRLKWLLLGR